MKFNPIYAGTTNQPPPPEDDKDDDRNTGNGSGDEGAMGGSTGALK